MGGLSCKFHQRPALGLRAEERREHPAHGGHRNGDDQGPGLVFVVGPKNVHLADLPTPGVGVAIPIDTTSIFQAFSYLFLFAWFENNCFVHCRLECKTIPLHRPGKRDRTLSVANELDFAAGPRVDDGAILAFFADNLHSRHDAVLQFRRDQKRAYRPQTAEPGILIFRPAGKEAQHVLMALQQHFGDAMEYCGAAEVTTTSGNTTRLHACALAFLPPP